MRCKICGQDNPPEAGFCANCGATLVARVEPPSVAAVPSPPPVAPEMAVKYLGFWIRFGAAIIDGVIVSIMNGVIAGLISLVLPRLTYEPVSMFGIFLPWLYYWLFIGLKGQTPGKMAFSIKVVNAQGDRPGLGGAALREVLGKLISTIGLFLGFLWIAWDREKQGWHDKIASTHVVKVVKVESKG